MDDKERKREEQNARYRLIVRIVGLALIAAACAVFIAALILLSRENRNGKTYYLIPLATGILVLGINLVHRKKGIPSEPPVGSGVCNVERVEQDADDLLDNVYLAPEEPPELTGDSYSQMQQLADSMRRVEIEPDRLKEQKVVRQDLSRAPLVCPKCGTLHNAGTYCNRCGALLVPRSER